MKTFSKNLISIVPISIGILITGCSSTVTSKTELHSTSSRETGSFSVTESGGFSNKRDPHSSLSANDTSVPTEDSSLTDYISYGLKANSTLRSAYESYRAALQKSPQVSSLPDPKLNYSYFIESVETRVGPQEHRVGFAQPIPWFGKLGLKGEIADSEAKAAWFAFLAQKNKYVLDLTTAYFELAYLSSASEITDANFELLRQWEQILTQRYRSQTGTQADLIKVQVELGKMEDKVKELEEMRVPLLARFNSLLNRHISGEVNVSRKHLEPTLTTGATTSVDQKVLQSEVLQSNPELLFLEALTQAKSLGINLANKNFYPDFSIGADYIFVGDREMAGSESGDDALVGMFSITLPLYRSKYEAGLAEAKSSKRSVEEMKRSKEFELSSKLAKTLFDIKDSKRRITLFQHTLVPKATESLESSYTAFEAGEISFVDLLDAERTLLDFKLSLSRAQADSGIAHTALAALVGEYSKNIDEESKL